MFCDHCGREIADDSEFCGYCGQAASPAVSPAGGASQQSPARGSPAQPVPAMAQVQAKKSALPWVLGGVGAAAAVAVVLVLVFTVFGGGGGKGDTAAVEQVVRDTYEAFSERDVEAFLGVSEPSYVKEIKDTLGKDYESVIEDLLEQAVPEGVSYEITEMETEIDKDKATVDIVGGTMTYTDEDGEEVSVDVSEADLDSIKLVKFDGDWYISEEAWIEEGFDAETLKGYLDSDESSDDEGDERADAPDRSTGDTASGAPLYPGAEVADETPEGVDYLNFGDAISVFETGDSVEEVSDWYEDRLSGKPNFNDFSTGDAGAFSFGTKEKMVSVDIFEQEGKTYIVMTSSIYQL